MGSPIMIRQLAPLFAAFALILPDAALAQAFTRAASAPRAVAPIPHAARVLAPLSSPASLTGSMASVYAPAAAMPAAALSAAAARVSAEDIQTPGPAIGSLAEEAAAFAEDAELHGEPVSAPVAAARPLLSRLADMVGLRRIGDLFESPVRARAVSAFGHDHILPEAPKNLPNGTRPDEEPTLPRVEEAGGVHLANFNLPGTRSLGRVLSQTRPLAADPADDDSIVAALRATVDADPSRYGVSSRQLSLLSLRRSAPIVTRAGTIAETVFVLFNQTQNGVAVQGPQLGFTLKVREGRVELLAETGTVYPRVPVTMGLPFEESQVQHRIAERMGLDLAVVAQKYRFVEEKIVYARGQDTPRQWRHVRLYAGEGLRHLAAIDLASGEVFAWDGMTLEQEARAASEAAGVSGKVSGRTVDKGPQLPDSQISNVDIPFVELVIGGKRYVTGVDGAFADPGLDIPSEGLALSAKLAGPWARVEDDESNNLSIGVRLMPGQGGRIHVVFNPDSTLNDENSLAQVNAFRSVNLVLHFLRSRKLTNARMDKVQIPIRTNIGQDCNAFYTRGMPTENFFRSSARCPNTAFDSVAMHETGHFWHDFTVGIRSRGLSEGWGDILSMAMLNDPIIGRRFLKQPRPGPDGKPVDYIRSGESKYQYNEHDGHHAQGQAWGGFYWKLRQALIAKLGEEEAVELVNSLVLPVMFAGSSSIPEAMAQVLANAATTDGRVLHEAEIRAAARAHGIELPGAPRGAAGFAQRMVERVLQMLGLRA